MQKITTFLRTIFEIYMFDEFTNIRIKIERPDFDLLVLKHRNGYTIDYTPTVGRPVWVDIQECGQVVSYLKNNLNLTMYQEI